MQQVLEPKFQGGSTEENLRRFEESIKELKKSKGGLGSNKQKGTAINVARKTYSKVRTSFGKIMEKKGYSIKGKQIHHTFDFVSKVPEKALDPAGDVSL